MVATTIAPDDIPRERHAMWSSGQPERMTSAGLDLAGRRAGTSPLPGSRIRVSTTRMARRTDPYGRLRETRERPLVGEAQRVRAAPDWLRDLVFRWS